jgi:hypothetical protein
VRVARASIVLAAPTFAQEATPDTSDSAPLLAHQRAIVGLVRRVQPAVVSVRRFVKDEKWWTEAQAKSVRVTPGWVQVPERATCSGRAPRRRSASLAAGSPAV